MPLEFVIRFRCDTCSLTLERPFAVERVIVPCEGKLAAKVLPPSWTAEGSRVYCAEHGRRVLPVRAVPGLGM